MRSPITWTRAVILLGDEETVGAGERLADMARARGMRVVAAYGWEAGDPQARGLAEVPGISGALAAADEECDLWVPFPMQDLASPTQLDMLAMLAEWRGSRLLLGRGLQPHRPAPEPRVQRVLRESWQELHELEIAVAAAAAAPALIDDAVELLSAREVAEAGHPLDGRMELARRYAAAVLRRCLVAFR